MTIEEIRKLADGLNEFANSCEKLSVDPNDIAIVIWLDQEFIDHTDMVTVIDGYADDKNPYFYLTIK